MRIPLDYYRILSVPIKATPQQLEQAYGDRLLQQPRKEYGAATILARRTLIQNAYQILSIPETRAEYDARYFSNLLKTPILAHSGADNGAAHEAPESVVSQDNAPPDLSSVNPTIEVPSEQFVGVLLILQELGEYELVLQLGLSYLNSPEYAELTQQEPKEQPSTFREDLILSLAIAYLELGREQWHRREYENAAASGQMGIDLLLQENLFSGVQEEIEIDLAKLRPYRILELISQNQPNSAARIKGFQLLQEMLRQRQGIEGKGEDLSGLTFDQFLCFIQQLRTYLTSAEQEKLFVAEANHASAIANYLAVYALLARGLVLKQPQLVVRAQQMLEFLSDRQDVYWERSVSALLLGQTEVALALVPNSQDRGKVELIKQYSQGYGDLLPGLCFYAEKWLYEEVIAQFCDLNNQQISLKEYFADTKVQAYLEGLASLVPAQPEIATPTPESTAQSKPEGLFSWWRTKIIGQSTSAPEIANSQVLISEGELGGSRAVNQSSSTVTLERGTVSSPKFSPTPHHKKRQPPITKPKKPNNARSSRSQPVKIGKKVHLKAKSVPGRTSHSRKGKPRYKSRVAASRQSKANLFRGRLLLASLVFGAGAIGFTATRMLLNSPFKTAKQEAQLTISVSTPPIEIPKVKIKAVPAKPKLTFNDRAKQVIQKWLDSKSAAFGKKHQIEALNEVLAAPLLTTWSDRARDYQRENAYREYEHTIKMRSATISKTNPDQATVEAEIREVAKHYQAEQLNTARSYDDNLLVRYQLVRQADKWLIQDAEVLKTL